MLTKESKTFFKLLGMKTLATFGFTFFSSLISLQLLDIAKISFVFYTAFIGAGLYFFTEMYKYYGLQPNKKVGAISQTKLYNFLI